MPLKYSSIDAPKAHCTRADSHICFMSATRYAHSIKKRRIIKFTDERGQLIRPDTFTKRLRKIYAASTTLDIYTHAFDKNKKAASAELQEMLEI